jgi:hypothetical protein
MSSHTLAFLCQLMKSIDAEGNGDSISAAVQAERIALLTSVLSQTQTLQPPMTSNPPQTQMVRAHSLTPPQPQRSFVDISSPKSHPPVHRSQSHFDMGAQYTHSDPIYQTSGLRQPSPAPPSDPLRLHAPAPLLPSFLQDIVQSPAISPTSTSSADLSFDEYEESLPSPASSVAHSVRNRPGRDSYKIALGNIWRLDGEETKTLSAFALPNHEDLVGGRKNSGEI